MAEQKGLGSKFLGLFVEKEGNAPSSEPEAPEGEKSAADLVAELAGQSHPNPKGAAPKAGAAPAPPSEGPPVNLKVDKLPTNQVVTDFDAIFKQAGMDSAELENVKKAEELLKGLPVDAPTSMKRTIVETTLRTMGFQVEKIVQAANNQLKALSTFVKVNEGAAQKATTDAQNQIRQLDEKIIALKVEIDKRAQSLTQVKSAADVRKAEVQKVLEFFAQPPPEAPKP